MVTRDLKGLGRWVIKELLHTRPLAGVERLDLTTKNTIKSYRHLRTNGLSH